MPEVSTTNAAQIIGASHETIRRYVNRGILSARQIGVRGILRIEIDDLRQMADEYQFRFDEDLAREVIAEKIKVARPH